jgi:glycosyltransferase involved in cell wall biosynthesis
MNVLVLSNAAPFIRGGAEELAENLVLHLNATKGVEAELIRIPFRWDPPAQIIQEILINRNLRLANVDRVIAMKFPAYLIPHQHKTLWLMHQFRQAYDLDRAGMTNIPINKPGAKIRNAVRKADNQCFAEAKQVFTISPIVSVRLQKFNSVTSDVLHHPLNDPERFQPLDYGNFIFAGGRVSPGKRQHLLIEAMCHTRTSLKLVVAGPVESEEYAQQLRTLIATNRLEERVDLKLYYASREEIISMVNNARACASVPIDEDSMSYVAMEAVAAGKCVVSCLDSGGLLEIVKDDVTGYVVAPDAASIGLAFDRLDDLVKVRALGRAARAMWSDLNISWSSRVARLLEETS